MTFLYWNGLAFAPVNKTAAKKRQLFCVLRQPSWRLTPPLLRNTAASATCGKTGSLQSSDRFNDPWGNGLALDS